MYNEERISDILRGAIGNDRILWYGRPKKVCLILESIFCPLMIFAIIWLLFDSVAISSIFSSPDGVGGSLFWTMIIFFLIHLAPVWIYLGGVISSFRKSKNTEYAITDRGIYMTSGVLSQRVLFKQYTEILHVDVHRDVFDQMFGTGDVIPSSYLNDISYYNTNRRRRREYTFAIRNVPDYIAVSNLIKKGIEECNNQPHHYNNSYVSRNNYQPNKTQVLNNQYSWNSDMNNSNINNGDDFYNSDITDRNYRDNQDNRDYRDTGYTVNGGSRDYEDSWDDKNKKNDRDSWD